MIIFRHKNDHFERFWPFSKFHFPACSTLYIREVICFYLYNWHQLPASEARELLTYLLWWLLDEGPFLLGRFVYLVCCTTFGSKNNPLLNLVSFLPFKIPPQLFAIDRSSRKGWSFCAILSFPDDRPAQIGHPFLAGNIIDESAVLFQIGGASRLLDEIGVTVTGLQISYYFIFNEMVTTRVDISLYTWWLIDRLNIKYTLSKVKFIWVVVFVP